MDIMVSISNNTTLKDIDNYIKNGVNIIRYNFSHIDMEWFKESYKYIRRNYPQIKLLQDLQGTKIRISSKITKVTKIDKAREVCICSDKFYKKNVYKVPYALIPIKWEYSFNILFNCQKCMIGGTEINLNKKLDTEALLGNLDSDLIIKPEKGVNFRKLDRKSMKLTLKDKQDLKILKEYPMDYVCLSFVEDTLLILELKEYLQSIDVNTKIIAKIETFNGYSNLNEILKEVSGIMLGRGDMVKEVSVEKFYYIQKDIVERMEKCNKYFIVGTYVLDNMINSKRPTVSELAAISYFQEHNVNCLMLANETLIGKHPQDVVRLLKRLL